MNSASPSARRPRDTLAVVRALLIVIWLAGLVGMGAELLLLGHTEGVWQWVPLILIVLSWLVLGWYAVRRRGACLRVFQVLMVLFLAGGMAGVVLHFLGKVEFNREMNPSLAGWALWRAAMEGAMPPILAPAAFIQFGLLGLVYTYRHPALAISTESTNQKNLT